MMPADGRSNVIDFLRRSLGGILAQRTDHDLLERFIAHRDECAFATLVNRHGSLVHGVCRRILRNQDEADDAFQATFLVLARKASSIRQPKSLGPWLYGVASRISRQARIRESVRRRHEAEAVVRRAEQSADDMTYGELRQLLDEELARLPEKFRAPLLLCCLQGKTRRRGGHRARLVGRLAQGKAGARP